MKTETTEAELNMLVERGDIKMPRAAGQIPTVPDQASLDSIINFRGTMQEIASETGEKIRGNIVGDGRIGATALETNRPLLTNDDLLRRTMERLGGETR